VLKSLDGKKVESPPEALTTYQLCKEFGWLPSQLDDEDNKTIEELLVVMNSINEHESKANKKNKREEAKNKFKGTNARR
jgi:hypothetical protein